MTIGPLVNVGSRRSLRLRGYDYRTPGAYFITIVTRDRVCCFGDVSGGRLVSNDAGRMVLATWEALPSRFPNVRTDTVVVMPNHVHGILWIDPVGVDRPLLLGTVVGAFKSTTTNEYAKGVKNRGWPPFRNALWQRNYFEHIIRTEKACTPIREYIANNPGQWHLDEENPSPAGQPPTNSVIP